MASARTVRMASASQVTPTGMPSAEAGTRRDDQLLVWAATFFAAAVLVHGMDHARRGADSLSLDVFWAGTAAITVEVGVVVLACQRHRLAPLTATVTGLSLALGYVVVHFLPARSWLSDSFTSGVDVSPLSWTAASLEVLAAAALGLAGLTVMHRRGGLGSATRPHPAQLPARRALTHPVVLAMIVGNTAILGVSVAQLFGT